jgi:hypothetical protein
MLNYIAILAVLLYLGFFGGISIAAILNWLNDFRTIQSLKNFTRDPAIRWMSI